MADEFKAEDWAADDAAQAPEIRQLRSEIKRLNRLLLDARSGEALVLDAVQEVYEEPPSLDIIRPKKTRKRKGLREEEAFLHISDTQIGKRTSDYDTQVAADRLSLLAEKAIKITEGRRTSARVDTIHILLGGDIVEGETIFSGQPWEVDSDLFDQAVKNAPAMLARVILRLSEAFPSVHIHTVPGNHGRTGPRGSHVSKRTNWDNVVYRITELMVMGPEGSKRHKRLKQRVEFNISGSFYTVLNVCGWGILGVHGDQIRGGFAGFPYYGVGRKAWGWIDAIPEPWRYLAFGHFHQFGLGTLNLRTFLANGTTESKNEYARAELAATGEPCQRLSFFCREYGLAADHQIFLGGEREPDHALSVPL